MFGQSCFVLLIVAFADGNVSVQKKFVRKEFNFGLQEGLTGTDLPVEESDFKMESVNGNNVNMKCVSTRVRARPAASHRRFADLLQ